MSEYMLYGANDVITSERVLHTPSDFTRRNFLYIQEVGRLKSLKPHVAGRENLDSYLFFAVVHGAGIVRSNGNEYHISEGDCVFLDCTEAYEHISDEKNPWELSWIHFNGVCARAYFELFVQKNGQKPCFSSKRIREYVEIIDSLLKRDDEKDDLIEVESAMQLTKVVTMILEDASRQAKESENCSLQKLRKIIDKRFKENNLLETLCAENGLDEIEINNVYKEQYGIDLYDYILNRRFTYAKELLRFSVKPVRQIVAECGIENMDLFRHLFIRNEGMTAEEYRQKWAQWNRE